MLIGISGSLVAAAFLDKIIVDELASVSDTSRLVRGLLQWWKRTERSLGPASSPRAVFDRGALPLLNLLGYELIRAEPHRDGFVGAVGEGQQTVAALCTTAWGSDADAAWRDTVRTSRVTRARWGLIYTGVALRIIDGSRPWSRRALEFDFRHVASDERSATAVCGLARRDTLRSRDGESPLEQLVRRSDAYGASVCATLGSGVIAALDSLVGSLAGVQAARGAAPDHHDTFQQSVTIVYRLLFLLFAEARHVVPMWHRVYRDAYTIDALCRRSSGRGRPRGLWSAVQAISRLAHAGCRAGDLSVTAFNGRLFSPTHTPLAERGRVPDEVMSRVILALATHKTADGQPRIAYGDLGVEQLGAVYEKVLEYEPAAARGPVILTRTSLERKATGSFYTPRAMTEFLVRRALHPLIEGRTADEILNLRVLDPAMGSGAFLVAACRYLANAADRALTGESAHALGDNTHARHAELRRVVAQRCLYGVDLNPMAVQLARLSLWLTTLASDRPLTFLDHHIAVGDSLVGAGLWDLAPQPTRMRAARSIRDLPLLADQTSDQLATQVLPERFRLTMEPDDTAAVVQNKERALAALTARGTPLDRWKTAANVWCGGWFRPGGRLPANMSNDLLASVLGRQPSLSSAQHALHLAEASAFAQTHRFFHWELEFPEVFFDRDGRRDPSGGFDAVIGNPPWDTLRADSGDQTARHHARSAQQARFRFFRDSGLYRHQGPGHRNRYQLFVERSLQLARPGGRIGLVLPSGLATDRGSARLRRVLLDSVGIDRLIGFDNRSGIFQIHRDVRFLLMTGTLGRRADGLSGTFGRSDADWLDELPDACSDDPLEARSITLSRRLLETLDRESLAFPLVVRPADVDLLSHVGSTVPALGSNAGWNVTFGRELNATDDRRHFVTLDASTDEDLIPIVEGKHIESFRARPQSTSLAIPLATALRLLDPQRTFRRRRIAYRDVASATNRLTLIAAVLPPDTVSTHTLFCLRTPLGDSSQYCLLSLLNSLVANYLVRLQVTTHVTTALMLRLPVPRPKGDEPSFRELAALARSLERTGIESDRAAYVKLNSIAARLYGLSPTQYEYVVSTFPLLPEELRRECVVDFKQ